MFELFDDIKIYLPKYLSEEKQRDLYNELATFPENIDKRFYSSYLKAEKTMFQGDGVFDVIMPVNGQELIKVKALLISNTCDASTENTRLFALNLQFAPIFNLKNYEDGLLKTYSREKVLSHTRAIREQKVTSFFYLPAEGVLLEDSFARFDYVFSSPIMGVSISELMNNRMFTLSNYGFYLFLIKLSMHFTRVQEAVNRDAP